MSASDFAKIQPPSAMDTTSGYELPRPVNSTEHQNHRYGLSPKTSYNDEMVNFDPSKTFDFLQLPAEIHNAICLHFVDTDRGWSFATLGSLIAALRPTEKAYYQALKVFYENARFTFPTQWGWVFYTIQGVPLKWRPFIKTFLLDFR
jgi:hypothetical protein